MIVGIISSCFNYKNETCRPYYIGTFTIDTNNLHVDYKNIILQQGWMSVKLISDSTGNYYFNTNDPILKMCEGTWYTRSDNLDGECIGYVKQNNLRAEHTSGFSIAGKIDDSINFILPFMQQIGENN